jgi:hypothetical protein
MKKEESLHIAICRYLYGSHPEVIFNTDLSGIRLTMGQASKVKWMRSSNSFPDLFIIEKRGEWAGLFIELKSRDAKLLRKDGFLCSDPHLRDQNDMLNKLEDRGFLARFCQGYDQTVSFIEWYLSIEAFPEMPKDPPVPKYKLYENNL